MIQGSHCKYYYWHESAACLPTKIHINSKWALAANLVNILAAASITILYLSDILISPGGGSQLSDITTGLLSHHRQGLCSGTLGFLKEISSLVWGQFYSDLFCSGNRVTRGPRNSEKITQSHSIN